MRSFFLASLLVVALPVNAALVDNSSFTTDTVSGLDWLDLDQTTYMNASSALTANPAWRLATYAEIENLFDQTFDGYHSTHIDGTSRTDAYNPYADQAEDVQNFISLFGDTCSWAGCSGDRSLGYYLDEDNIWRSMGVHYYPGDDSSIVYGLEYDFDQTIFATSSGSSYIGTYLVRSSVVPIPAAVWLFGSALAGLGWMRRKQAA